MSSENFYEDNKSAWDEVKGLYSKAWSTRCDPVASNEFINSLSGFLPHDVKDALRQIFAEQERSIRPSVKQVINKCYDIKRNQRQREIEDNPEKICKWCEGHKTFYVWVYGVHVKDLPPGFAPSGPQLELMKKISNEWYLVEPKTAKEKGMKAREERLWCHRCQIAGDSYYSYNHIGKGVREYVDKFDKFIDWERSGVRDSIDRLFKYEPEPSRILGAKEIGALLKEYKNDAIISEFGSDYDAIESEDFSKDLKEIAGPA